jgi:hypothetical protein
MFHIFTELFIDLVALFIYYYAQMTTPYIDDYMSATEFVGRMPKGKMNYAYGE